MSSDESNDAIAELQEIIKEQNEKDKKTNDEDNNSNNSSDESDNSTEIIPLKKKKRDNKKNSPEDWIKTEEEIRLEKLLFGDKDTLLKNFERATEEVKPINNDKTKQRKPAWNDSGDEECLVGEVIRENKRTGPLPHLNKEKSYKEFLTNKFTRIQEQPKWADLDQEREIDSDEELLQSVGHLSQTKSSIFPANNLQFKKLKDLNRATYAEGGITSIQFHPLSTVALVAGYSGTASIYSIDGQKNDKLHSIYFKKFPIKCSRILQNGTEALIGSSKKYYYSYDLMLGKETRLFLPKIITKLTKFEISPCGKYFAVVGRFGEIHLMDLKTKELLHTFKQEYPCTALHFSNDSNKLFSHSSGPEVNIFDMRIQRIEHVFIDDGCINGKTISISPNNMMFATGSNEGVVNIYNYSDIFTTRYPKPQKIIYNLTTSISATKFNHSSEILGISSDAIDNAVKLVHFPSGTVFANFPGQQTHIGKVGVLEFSPGSGYMAVGNNIKQVPLFRLKHFKNY